MCQEKYGLQIISLRLIKALILIVFQIMGYFFHETRCAEVDVAASAVPPSAPYFSDPTVWIITSHFWMLHAQSNTI